MSTTITIQTRLVGSRKPLLDDWSIPLPPELGDGEGRITLRELIVRVVLAEVQAFRVRQSEQRFLRVLTQRQMEDDAARGRVLSGQRELPPQSVDEDQAIGTALQAFEDGLYLVMIDDQLQRRLDSEVHLRPDSRVTFVRLTMLAGSF